MPHAAIGIGLLFGGGGLALALWRDRLRLDRHRRLRPRRPGADRPRAAAGPARTARLGRADGGARDRPGLAGLGEPQVGLGRAAGESRPADARARPPPCSPARRSGTSPRPISSPPAGWPSRWRWRWSRGGWTISRPTSSRWPRPLPASSARSAMVPDLWSALLAGLVGLPVTAADLPDAMAGLYSLALPALLLAALHLALPPLPLARALGAAGARRPVRRRRRSMSGSSRRSASPSGEDFVARGLIERTILTQALFAAGWLLGAGIVRPPRMAPTRPARGTILTALAAARLIWFDMVLFNPAWAGPVGRHAPGPQPDPARLSAERGLALCGAAAGGGGDPLGLLARRLPRRFDRRRRADGAAGLPGADPDRAGHADRRILRLFAGRARGRDRPDPRRHAPARQGAAARRAAPADRDHRQGLPGRRRRSSRACSGSSPSSASASP